MNPAARRLAGIALGMAFAAGSAANARAEEGSFVFSWPVPGRVRVLEKSDKRGGTATTEYDLVINRAPDGTNLEVRFENFRFVVVNGQDATTPEMKEALGPTAVLASAMPTFLISPEGDYLDAVGMEETIEKTLAFMRESGAAGQDPATIQQVEATMRSPQMVAQMRAKAGDHWMVWVGLWAGVELSDGGTVETTTAIPMPDGSTVDAPLTFRHAGQEAGAGGRVTLEAESILEGEEATRALERAVRSMAGPQGAPPPGQMFASFRREFKARVITDPKTLRPSRATSEAISRISAVDGEERTQKESHVYEFHWSVDSSTGEGK